jgi:hypothetical protein
MLDVSEPELEPIRLSAAVESHGALLVMDPHLERSKPPGNPVGRSWPVRLAPVGSTLCTGHDPQATAHLLIVQFDDLKQVVHVRLASKDRPARVAESASACEFEHCESQLDETQARLARCFR